MRLGPAEHPATAFGGQSPLQRFRCGYAGMRAFTTRGLGADGQGQVAGQWYILSSTGANAMGSGALDNVSYWDSTYWQHDWVKLPNVSSSAGDWSFGVAGTLVPEPSSILTVLFALAVAAPVRRFGRR